VGSAAGHECEVCCCLCKELAAVLAYRTQRGVGCQLCAYSCTMLQWDLAMACIVSQHQLFDSGVWWKGSCIRSFLQLSSWWLAEHTVNNQSASSTRQY